jgi:hypothetical protein
MIAPGVVLGGVTAAYYEPFIIGILFHTFMSASFKLALMGIPIAAAVGLLPFFGMGIKSMVMNNRIKKDLHDKMITGYMTIYSGEKYEGLIFVKRADYKPQFNIVIHELNNRQSAIVFDVQL